MGEITQTDFGYTFQRGLPGTGLMDYRARFYAPYITHFSQPDSIIPDFNNPQALNRYAYALNNPINYNDPSGHCPWCIAVGVGAVVGAAIGYGTQVYNNYQNGSANPWTSNISADPIVNGAFIGSGAVLAAGLIATAPIFAAPAAAAGLACADGDCSNEISFTANKVNQACGGDMCASEVQDAGNAFKQAGLRFTQTTASPNFSSNGRFPGETIGSLSEKLRSGAVNLSDVPVNFIERDGLKLIENTRSALALLRSGTSIDKWNLINQTGNAVLESKITQRLLVNGLTKAGTTLIRITGFGKFLSNLK